VPPAGGTHPPGATVHATVSAIPRRTVWRLSGPIFRYPGEPTGDHWRAGSARPAPRRGRVVSRLSAGGRPAGKDVATPRPLVSRAQGELIGR
jgi:hypothetical protein